MDHPILDKLRRRVKLTKAEWRTVDRDVELLKEATLILIRRAMEDDGGCCIANKGHAKDCPKVLDGTLLENSHRDCNGEGCPDCNGTGYEP